MGVDDFMDREAGAIAAATAAAVSPRARELLRRGAVYGLAGLLKAGDVALAATRGAVRGAKDGAAATTRSSSGTASHSRQSRRTSGKGSASRGGRSASGGTRSTRSSRSGSSRTTRARSRGRASSGASNK